MSLMAVEWADLSARISEDDAQALGISVRAKGKSRYPVAPKEQRTLDGIVFDSKAEAQRYAQHKNAVRAGYITDLELQPRYDFVLNGKHVFTYRADFRYTLVRTGQRVIEDVKSTGTQKDRDFHLRKKLIELAHGIEIKVVIGNDSWGRNKRVGVTGGGAKGIPRKRVLKPPVDVAYLKKRQPKTKGTTA